MPCVSDSAAPRAPAVAPVTRTRTLFAGRNVSLRLSWYAPGQRMQRHEHARHQVSLLLSGTLGESQRGDEVRLDVPAIGVKPAGLVHANDYGPRGALMLGIDVDECVDLWRQTGLANTWRWRVRPAKALLLQSRVLLANMLECSAADIDAEGRIWELLSGMTACDDAPGGTPPRWIARACMRLHEDATPLVELARDEGLHPVYFSRAFLRWTGCQPSTFRARSRFQRALAALSAGQSVAMAALEAGFSDQAHFSRAAREHSGLSPRQLRALVA